jgi:hypothetical protein
LVSLIQDKDNCNGSSSSNAMLKLSYGKTTTTASDDNHLGDDCDKNSKVLQYLDGKIVVRIDASTLVAATLSLLTIFAIVQKKR